MYMERHLGRSATRLTNTATVGAFIHPLDPKEIKPLRLKPQIAVGAIGNEAAIRALLGTASHFCDVVVPESKSQIAARMVGNEADAHGYWFSGE